MEHTMTGFDRRNFLGSTALGLGALALGAQRVANAAPPAGHGHGADAGQQTGYTGPIGIQLYTLGDAVKKDMAATFAMLAQFGYREVEALQYDDIDPVTIRREAANAGLFLRSTHLNFGQTDDVDALLDIAAKYGVTQVASSVLPPRVQDSASFIANVNSLTPDDFKRIAERANKIGERARRAGFRYAYHNHNYEFRTLGRGVVGYDILLRETDPALVDFEADCGWIRAAGADPLFYLTKHAQRYTSMHVKNFDTVNFSTTPDAASQAHVAPLGSGVIDYMPILRAALEAGISYMFAEHDPRNGVPITNEQIRQEGADLRGYLSKLKYNPAKRPR
jgi:sugar phosphate isomerase/epimerase